MSPSRRRLARMSASRSVEWRWCHEEAGERLQPQERLLGGAQKAEGQAKPVETGGPALVQSLYVVHCDDRVPTDPRPVTTLQLDRLFPAEDIDWIVFLELADQREILDKNPMRRRVPASIDDEDVKACRSGRSSVSGLSCEATAGVGFSSPAVGIARVVGAGAAVSLRAPEGLTDPRSRVTQRRPAVSPRRLCAAETALVLREPSASLCLHCYT
jgi:hypothetical protein